MAINSMLNDYLLQQKFTGSAAKKNDSVATALAALMDGEAASVQNSYAGFNGITDSLSLSAESLQAYSANYLNRQLFGVASETINGQYKTLERVQQDYFDELSGFTNLASSLFSIAGVSSAVTLQMNGVGGLFQTNPNKDSAAVRSVLDGEQGNKLTSRFALVAARAAILEAAKDESFTSDYNTNPPATMEKYEARLKELMLNFQLTLESGKAVSSFALTDDE